MPGPTPRRCRRRATTRRSPRLEGKIYFAGGRFGASTDCTNLLDIYDPKTNTWTSGPPMPTPRSGLAGTFYKACLWCSAGKCRAR